MFTNKKNLYLLLLLLIIVILIIYINVIETFEDIDLIGTHPRATYPEITIIKDALNTNDETLSKIHYNILDKQDILNTLTQKLNNVKINISSLKENNPNNYSNKLIFY